MRQRVNRWSWLVVPGGVAVLAIGLVGTWWPVFDPGGTTSGGQPAR